MGGRVGLARVERRNTLLGGREVDASGVADLVCEREQFGRRRRAHGGRSGDDRQLEDVALEVRVQSFDVGVRLVAQRLIATERPDGSDGFASRVGPGEQVESTGDEDVGGEDLEIGLVVGVGVGVTVTTDDPGFLVGQRSRQAKALVDELDARRTVGDALEIGGRIDRSGALEREYTGCHRCTLERVGDNVVQLRRLDVRDGVTGGAPATGGPVHQPGVTAGEAKTFGNADPPSRMIDSHADGRVRTITIDRPDARNALTWDGLDELEAAVAAADEPVIYLEGAGPAFCAGADLDVVADLDDDGAEEFARRGQRVARAIETSASVVVAGIDGAARGGGLELALACDVRVATPEATFGEPGVTFGLFGAWGGTVRLPRVIGEGNALEFALSGRVVDAETALEMGLVSRIVADPRSVATEIAENAPDALTVLKRRLRDDADRETRERREAKAFAELVAAHADDVAALRGED